MGTIAAAPIAVVIPAVDGAPVIGSVVAAVRGRLRAGMDRAIEVDNGSADSTAERAAEAGAEVVREPRRGYGRACWAGWEV